MTSRLLFFCAITLVALGCNRSTGVVRKVLDAAATDAVAPADASPNLDVARDTSNAGLLPEVWIARDAALTVDSSGNQDKVDVRSDTQLARDAANAPEAGLGRDAPLSDAMSCTNTFASGNHAKTMTWAGVTRNYLVHVPASYDGSKQVPLVIDMHGFTESATQQAGKSGWRAKSDEVGFIVVHPNGLNASWNGGGLCCGLSQLTGVDDEGFIKALVGKMRDEACIDAKRVYATGFSNGGAMTHLLACHAADVFAAAAPISMGNGTSPCKPARPLPVVLFRGTSDLLVAYGGGLFPSAHADFDQWKTLNGCTGEPTKTHGLCQTYAGCKAGVEVTLCTISAGHDLYAAAAAAGAAVADVAWEAFSAATLP